MLQVLFCFAVKKLVSQDAGSGSQLVRCQNRGGLSVPIQEILPFFYLCESTFLTTFLSAKSNTFKNYVECIFSNEEILCLFCNCINIDEECQVEICDQEAVLRAIL